MMDINEPLAALRSNINYQTLILTSLSGNFEASNLDNILDSMNAGFLIIGHLDQIDDFSGELLILAKMKQIGTDIIARMLHDHMKCELLTLKAIPGFNINSVSYEMLGPVFDNDYGVMYSFKLLDCLGLEFDPATKNKFRYFDFMGIGSPQKPYGVRNFKTQFGGEVVNFGRWQLINSTLHNKLGLLGYKILRLFSKK